MSTCPHPDCKERVARGVFACRSHWFSLPKDLRDRIWANFRSNDMTRIVSGYDEAEHWWTT